MESKDFLPIPDLDECRTLLCVQPHPDDNEVGAGATIARLASRGCRIVYLTVTNGNMGSFDPGARPEDIAAIRRSEAVEAASVLGVAETRFLDYDDAGWPDEKRLCMDIACVIRDVRPEMILTVDPFLPYEVHPDHLKVGMATAQAFLLCPFPHFPGAGCVSTEALPLKGLVFHSTAWPNTFIDANETWEKKIMAIEKHQSQFGPGLTDELKAYFDYKARTYGSAAGFERAEAFKVLTGSHLHMNVDTIRL